MPSGKSTKAVRDARAAVGGSKPKPWGWIAAVVGLLVFAAAVFVPIYLNYDDQQDLEAQLAAYTPSAENQDPSTGIPDVEVTEYQAAAHVRANERVAYDQSPPFGGPHDEVWADCTGTVYDTALRNENMVHALEHGAVWIAYNPDQISGEGLDALRERVEGQQFIMLSPYPGLDRPISLQSWGHRLKLDNPDDIRIDQFIRALARNEYTYPEVGATCATTGTPFDAGDPPPFDPSPPGPNAVPMESTGTVQANEQMGG